MIATVLSSVFVFCGTCLAQPRAADLERALRNLENVEPSEGRHMLNESVHVIRSRMTPGDIATWRRLKLIIADPSIPLPARMDLFRVAADKADARIAADMLALAVRWSDELPAEQILRAAGPEEPARTSLALLSEFVRRMPQDRWNRWIGDSLESVRVLENVILKTGYGPGIGNDALRALGANRAHPQRRRGVAEAIVAANPRSTEVPAVLLSFIDESSLPKLRELVRASADAESFHYGAAAALAHLGDREIVADLEAARTMLRAKHVNLEGYVIYYIWQITIQHPVSKLLDFIASTERLLNVETRMWAVRRAVELDIPKEKIREALLKHAKQVEPKVFREADGREVKVWPGLASLKRQGLKLGILRTDDLPRVKVPKVEPMP